MIRKLIDFFVERHLLTNLICAVVLIGGILAWQNMKKEEMPDVTFDFVRISASYPGATAEEVEHFITKPIEDVVRGLDGVYRVTSSSSQGSASVSVEIEQHYPDKDEVIMEIRNAVFDVDLPDDVRDDPDVRVFKTSKKAIVDVVLIDTSTHLLDVANRQKLQEYAYALETQLLNLPQVNSINRSGYLQEEIQIKVDPEKLIQYRIPLSQVMSEVKNNHIRQPAGNIEAKNEPKVTLSAQLDSAEKLNDLIIQAGFEGTAIPLRDIADVQKGFDRDKNIQKTNGHESIVLNVVKSGSYGILESLEVVKRTAQQFKENQLSGTPIDLLIMDDASVDVRNRLSIIATNGGMGFILVVAMLFLFLNKRSGLWVAMGIPFSIAFTLIGGWMMGYTINNTTLAAVIIVMGMIVDDAIVVAENISRLKAGKLASREAVVGGTAQVFLPIVASIVTTCIAFIPLFFFSGRFGRLITFIPPVIFLMLGASLLESLIILPGHMYLELPNQKKEKVEEENKAHWFDAVENWYGGLLIKVLPRKAWILGIFIVLLIFSGWIMKTKMKYVMFPDEETRDITISGYAADDADRYDTAEITRKIEEIIRPYVGKEVIGLNTHIARNRRGGAVEENQFRMMIEIVPKEKRKKSADQLVNLWKKDIAQISGLQKMVYQKNRWGQEGGNPIEIIVQQNNDEIRETAANKLADLLKAHPDLVDVDIERPVNISEYKIDLQREKIKRLSVSAADIASTFRASLQGSLLYEIPQDDEEVDVRLTVKDSAKTDIAQILDVPVENRSDYLVPLGDLVTVKETVTPNSISRRDLKRTTTVYANIKKGVKKTPVELAKEIEADIFPQIVKEQASTALSFIGEVQDTRESAGDFRNAVFLALFLIFAVLAVLLNSLIQPFIIMLAIPFGVVGIVLAFILHGKFVFGFFAAVGALGLAGVVINDSIVMLARLNESFDPRSGKHRDVQIARIAQTRLRAVMLTTLTTVAGVLPTAYGLAGYDSMLAEMMLALAWGLSFGTAITLFLVPCVYSLMQNIKCKAGAGRRPDHV